MRSSARGGGGEQPSDITTRARIRDAAIRLFGRDGFAATSLRAVAAEAGVSAGLVIHHFGSKDGLRSACDQHMVHTFISRAGELEGSDASGRIREWLADVDRYRPEIDYISRMLTQDGAAADAVFDALLAGTRHMLETQTEAGVARTSSDPEVTAAIVTAYGVTPLLLGRQLGRVLGEAELSESLIRRLTIPVLELYTHGLYADDRMLQAAKDALHRPSGPHSDKGEQDPNQDPDPPGTPASR